MGTGLLTYKLSVLENVMKCLNCHEEIPEHVRSCVVCGADAGYPNVRAALHSEETTALELRVKEAEENANLQGCDGILKSFRKDVANSSAVVCCSLGKLNELASSDNLLYQTFYQAIGSEARLPEDNEYDTIREAVDSLFFPHYHEQIRFGALSINRTGISGYGYCMVLKEMAIKDRATVFEENLILFVKRLRIVAGDPLPLGCRAPWAKRDLLAVAKLGKRITPTTTQAEFSELLISSPTRVADIIEVHIYGPIHRRAIEHLSGREPRQRADKVLLKSVIKKLKEIGVTAEIS